MPGRTRTLSTLSVFAAAITLTACARQTTEAEPAMSASEPVAASTVRLEYPRTRKPGAAVEFTHEFESEPEVGQLTTVEISIRDYYGNGTLTLEARGDDSLVVFTPTASMTASMTGTDAHIWRVSFEPKTEGVHYLNVFATVDMPDMESTVRSHAIRIEVGEVVSSKTAAEPMNGEQAIMLEAEETIE